MKLKDGYYNTLAVAIVILLPTFIKLRKESNCESLLSIYIFEVVVLGVLIGNACVALLCHLSLLFHVISSSGEAATSSDKYSNWLEKRIDNSQRWNKL